MLNPELDTAALAEEYARDGRVRIKNLFTEDFARRIAAYCQDHVPYEYLTHVDGKNVVISAAEMEQLSPEQLQQLNQSVTDNARQGRGFFYCGYKMQRADNDSDDEAMRELHSVFDYLNGEEMLSFIAAISGRDDLQSADAQYTRYTAGQFLTRHRDDVDAEQRRLAYVISFTEGWHPDWGGLLQFYAEDGSPRDAWAPEFNSMSLFDVSHIHAVTFVAPFHALSRCSLTGWFRARPR
jgi:Rps23 Pro-64 3,4-dihydroxylase Tpa1-like proline 4-hydroxylase